MVAIVDYGVGNLFSLVSSLRAVGQQAVVTGEAEVIRRADRVILPGVGAFGDAVEKLNASGLKQPVLDCARSGRPLMGICLGMQMLFEKSLEFGEHEGLGLLRGQVVPMCGALPSGLKIPHIGWNALHFKGESPLFKYVQEGECVYFVHSYFAAGCDDSLVASTRYGLELTAAVQRDNVFGCQFHPEKSGPVGLNILKAFCEV